MNVVARKQVGSNKYRAQFRFFGGEGVANMLRVGRGGDGGYGDRLRCERCVFRPKMEAFPSPDSMKDEHGQTISSAVRDVRAAAAANDCAGT